MGKIPVLQTITETYAFAFRRYFPILGVIWLPFLLIGAAAYYILLPALTVMVKVLAEIAQHALQNPQTPYLPPSIWSMMGGTFLFEFIALVIICVVAVGITKEALDLRRGPRFVYLAVGKSELLVIGGMFTILALYLVSIVVVGIVGGIAGAIIGTAMLGSSGAHVDPAAQAESVVVVVRWLTILFYLVFFYFVVRLTFFLVPISTAEGRFGVWRSWALTKGNFWRIVGVILGTFLPITILSYALWYFVFGPALFQSMWTPQVHPEVAAAQLGAQLQMFMHYALYFGIYALLFAPISYGLMFGQSAIAYRAVVGDKAEGPWGKS
jgi:hypothetical protein